MGELKVSESNQGPVSADGSFRFSGVPAGRVDLRIQGNGICAIHTITIPPEGDVNVTVRARASATLVLEGRAGDKALQAHAWIRVPGSDWVSTSILRAPSGKDYKKEIEVPSGLVEYRVVLTSDSAAPVQKGKVKIAGGERVRIALQTL